MNRGDHPGDANPTREGERERRSRHRPAHGVLLSSLNPTIVFLTVCTKNREPWLADPQVHGLLRAVWMEADAWLVGRYMLMPDHVHLFCAPNEEGSGPVGGRGSRRAPDGVEDGSAGASPSQRNQSSGAAEALTSQRNQSSGAPAQVEAVFPSLDNWVRYWKSQFAKRGHDRRRRWQPDHWDTRLKHEESYNAKWDYVRNNPVRARLVARPEDWPYAGELHALRW